LLVCDALHIDDATADRVETLDPIDAVQGRVFNLHACRRMR
jgi:hypothetical protein